MTKNIISVKNKTILVTGSYGYIGKQICEDLSNEGANLILNGRNLSKLKEFKKKLSKYNTNVKLAHFDINNIDKVKNFFKKDHKSVINSIIHNANYSNIGGIKVVKEEDYIHSYKTAVIAAQTLLKCSFPNLVKSIRKSNFASFINIASIYGFRSPIFENYKSEKYFNPPNYGASKSALIQWTKYAACEYGIKGIRFNSISPGPIPNLKNTNNKILLNKLKKRIPLGNFGNPKDLSGIIIYLCSNSSSFVNGSNIVIDGGWSSW